MNSTRVGCDRSTTPGVGTRKKEAGDASAARDQTRVTNKAAFRF